MAHLLIWQHAASLQAMRVLVDGTGFPDGPIGKQADCYMFVIAVRNALRGVDLVRKVSDKVTHSQIDLAKNTFNKQVPRLIDLRNVLDHFDMYAVGKGELQGAAGWLPNAWFERTENSYVYNVGVSRATPLLQIDVRTTHEALMRLVNAVGSTI